MASANQPWPRNLAHEAVIHGHTVLFTSAGQLLGELASLDSDSALRRRLRYYVAPTLLLIDEVGYLSYSNRHADLMFELISRRYEQKTPSSPPIAPLPNGARCSPMPPASCPWSTG
jgi:DNA replication protein DnaC